MKNLTSFTEDELFLLKSAGPLFTISSNIDGNTCNLQFEPCKGQVYKMAIKKMEKYFKVDILISGEGISKDNYLTLEALLGLVRTVNNSIFEFFMESVDEEDSKLTVEYLS